MEENKNEDLTKKVDESWKEAIRKEKGDDGAPTGESPKVTFSVFVSGLMMESLIALGEVESPITKKKEFSRDHAKFLIDTLAMLDEKTKNNLTDDEKTMLEAVLYELRMRFLSKMPK